MRISVDLISTVGHQIPGGWKSKTSKVLRLFLRCKSVNAIEKMKNALTGYSVLLSYWNVQGTEICVSTYIIPY